jgi:hypothetical protein
MMTRLAIALFVLGLAPSIGMRADSARISFTINRDDEPDPRLCDRKGLCPDTKDLERLKSVEGKPKWQIIRTLGHPMRVGCDKNGADVWEYPWMARCQVWIKDGVCIRTFYTGGY